MRKFNPETMKLEIGGGKEINVSHHAVWCAMQIPYAGGDPLPMSDADPVLSVIGLAFRFLVLLTTRGRALL
jgi:hypothetical protein